ncbi:uncharacterized protein KQ657_002193 [Scheffersomyces spartinae]|uniref:Dipeptidyl peptidase 3 n=1 Tax=Scheffersomyces spartinae TaxID=45513 RepID=A0A9P7VCX1_9ASCO|nr:uncharacterized protein KQ657_002193 [Scheffersomyces spartinae]KAG7195808.1 hypothetical protein KQ657_002193 [Scheffersomyces spartinae]
MSFYADSEAPIVQLSAKPHFDALTAKAYAHYMSKASHWGSRAVLRSVSPESNSIYDVILGIHSKLGSPDTQETYTEKLKDVFTPEKTLWYLEYASQFLSNLGNYKLFGDKKFIPKLPHSEFDKLALFVFSEDSELLAKYKSISNAIYSTDKPLLGWPEKNQVSAYYPESASILEDEVVDVNSALMSKGIMPENTRVEKVSPTDFIVHVASAEATNKTGYYPDTITTSKGAKIEFKFGDHAPEFIQIVENLKKARDSASNDTQRKMLDNYIESFATGSMNAHKESQKQWVKDLKPAVETNIGFIETYRDPSGVRGEWEGLVAMVNHERTAKFSSLVENATTLIKYLPWDKLYEKDTFTPPDFTSLEVLTFAGSGIPAGINIPNYDDVRLNVGFKNVSLGNVLSANPKKPKKQEVITFLEEGLQELFRKWRDDAFEVQVGLHELLGHGTGKLLQETSPGVFNFDKEGHPEIVNYYKPSQTWGSLFGLTSGSFEECRAELVALYLILKKPLEVLPIFGINDAQEQDDVMYIATVLMCRAGLLALEFWDPESKKWGQPHMQARFGIFKTLFKAGVASLKYTDNETFSDLLMVVDKLKLTTAGVEALGDFLLNLHVFKATGNVIEGVAYYTDITEVTPEFSRFRDVVLAKKLPRRQLIQGNTFLGENGEFFVKEYEETEVGMIQSFADREI